MLTDSEKTLWMLTDIEKTLMQASVENLRLTGLGVWRIAENKKNKKLYAIAEKIFKLHGALETEYGKMIAAKARKPSRKKEKMDGIPV